MGKQKKSIFPLTFWLYFDIFISLGKMLGGFCMNKTSARFVCALILLFMLFFCVVGAQAALLKPDLCISPSAAAPRSEDICLMITAGDMRLAIIPSGSQIHMQVTPPNWLHSLPTDVAGAQIFNFTTSALFNGSCLQSSTIQSYICHPHQGPPLLPITL